MPRRAPSRRAAIPQGTSDQILDVAERFAQTRGFNGFSYADVATELRITKAGLHYHYPTKADLGRALIERYSKGFGEALQGIEASGAAPPAQLRRYVDIYAGVLNAGRICLCGMFAAEYTTLPDGMQKAIRGFFDLNEKWLSRLLESGRKDGSLVFDGSAQESAVAITSALEGSMLLARTYGGPARFKTAAERVLREFASSADSKPGPQKASPGPQKAQKAQT